MRTIFVQHGKYATYNILVERCQLIQDVDVRWDRRLGGERRRLDMPAAADRRRQQDRRRHAPPDTELRGYTVVDLG